MKPLFAFLMLSVLTSAPQPALAQVSPANMRSGVDSMGVVDAPAATHSKVLFTVPAGSSFVLTDVSIGNLFSASPSWVLDGTSPRAILLSRILSGSALAMDKSWETGLVFDSGHQVVLQAYLSNRAFFSWSGYLVSTATSAVPPENSQQLGFSLSPNPAHQVVALRFELAHAADVNLGIYDAQGRRVRTVASGQLGAGAHVKTWDGRTESGDSAPSGVYFARLESSEANSVRRLVRIR